MLLQFDTFYINPIDTKDAWPICDFAVANEERLKLYFPGTLAQNLTPDLSKRFTKLKTKQFDLKEEFLFTLKEKETHQIAGLVYIKELDWEKRQGEFAYCIGYPFKGKGLASRTVKLLSEYAFKIHDLKTLQIISHKDNLSSISVAENCNFIWQRTLKNEFTPTGENPLDMELYELYNEG